MPVNSKVPPGADLPARRLVRRLSGGQAGIAEIPIVSNPDKLETISFSSQDALKSAHPLFPKTNLAPKGAVYQVQGLLFASW